jgi:hypothetical protein
MRAPLPLPQPLPQATPASRVRALEPAAPRGLDGPISRSEPLDLKAFPTPQARKAGPATAAPTPPPPGPAPLRGTQDYAAMGSLLDQLAQDQRALRALLAAHPGPIEALAGPDRAALLTLLKRRDATEELLQAQWGEHPLPQPAATPSSARPLLTPTPLP